MFEKKESRMIFAAISGWIGINAFVWGVGVLLGSSVGVAFVLAFTFGVPIGLLILGTAVSLVMYWVNGGE